MNDKSDEKTQPGVAERFYESLMASREISREQLENYQREVFSTYVTYVSARSEFHAARLSPVLGKDGPNFARWQEIPILTKSELLANRHRWRLDDIPANHGRILLSESSSSTGISVALPKTQMTETAVACAAFRHAALFGLDYGKPLVMLRALNRMLARRRSRDEAQHAATKEYDRSKWGPAWVSEAKRGSRHYMPVSRGVEKIFTAIEAAGAADGFYLNTSPSKALELANHIRRYSVQPPHVLALLCVGEPVPPALRQEVSDHLGCDMIDVYGAAEVGPIAMQCATSGLYHVQSELAYVELLDEMDQPVGPGQTGRVVVTPFYNLAMPLIRFDTGDLAVAGAACDCDAPHAVITKIIGRSVSQLKAADGNPLRVSPDFAAMRTCIGECRWRLVQPSDGEVELHFMQTPDGEKIDADAARAQVHAMCDNDDIVVRLKEVDVLGPTGGGKFTLTHRS